MIQDVRQYGEDNDPITLIVIGFETEYVTRKVDGKDTQVPREKAVLGKLGDATYRQNYWISRLAGEASDAPRLWHEVIKPVYDNWKKGEEIVHQGTPLAVLGTISPKTIQHYRMHNIHTVEQFGLIQDGDLPRLGLEARAHRDLCRKYVEAANSETQTIVAKQAEQDKTIADQAAELAELRALLKAKSEKKAA